MLLNYKLLLRKKKKQENIKINQKNKILIKKSKINMLIVNNYKNLKKKT